MSARRCAAMAEDQQITYQNLDRRTNRLARFLRRLGMPRGALVGVCMTRSSRVVVAVLSILKEPGVRVLAEKLQEWLPG
jgi:non-ribosomal peptide synthetase component F